jgi:hypothetical protein
MLYTLFDVKKVLPHGMRLLVTSGKISGLAVKSTALKTTNGQASWQSMSIAKYGMSTVWDALTSKLEGFSTEELITIKKNIPQIDPYLLYTPTTIKGQKAILTRKKNKDLDNR